MAVSNFKITTTFTAGEALTTHQYFAVALNDGQIANNGEEASGILQNKPASGEFGTMAWAGESKYIAGAAIAAGDKLTVTTSGYMITAGSDDPVVGETKGAVTSGSIGVGLFVFPNATDKADSGRYSFTPATTIPAGIAMALDDKLQANNGEEADAIAVSAVSSGVSGEFTIFGIAPVRLDPAQVASAGDALTVTTSGYFVPGDSGDYIKATALVNIGSNATGDASILPVGYYLSV